MIRLTLSALVKAGASNGAFTVRGHASKSRCSETICVFHHFDCFRFTSRNQEKKRKPFPQSLSRRESAVNPLRFML